MPKGPRGQKTPADVIGNAVRVMRIATGEGAEDAQADRDYRRSATGRFLYGDCRAAASNV